LFFRITHKSTNSISSREIFNRSVIKGSVSTLYLVDHFNGNPCKSICFFIPFNSIIWQRQLIAVVFPVFFIENL
jgi:hypothetical protein